MVRRYGAYVLNSDTAYCFGGDDTRTLHQSQRSRLFFIHDKALEIITPISDEEAQSFADEHNFKLIRKKNVRVSVAISYDNYHKLSDYEKGSQSKIKGFVKKAVINEINKLPPS